MTWWFGFCLGLPARPEDIDEIRKSVPELIDAPFQGPLKQPFPLCPTPRLSNLPRELLDSSSTFPVETLRRLRP